MNAALRLTATLALGTLAALAIGCGSSYDATELQRCGGQPCATTSDSTLPSGSGTNNASSNPTGSDDVSGSTVVVNAPAKKTPASATCSYSSECGENRVCANGACLVPCGEGDLCAAGSTCEKGLCAPSGPGTVACADDSSCGSGEACTDGTCQIDTTPETNCARDLDCGGSSAKKCVDGFCKFTCASDLSCKQIDSRIGYCAADNVCRTAIEAAPECIASNECSDGKSCIGNLCL